MRVEILLGCVGFISGVWKFSWVWKIFSGNFFFFFFVCHAWKFIVLVWNFSCWSWNLFCWYGIFFFCVQHVLESLLNELMEMKNLGLMEILVG